MTCRILLPGQIPPSAIDMARDVNRKMKAAAMRSQTTHRLLSTVLHASEVLGTESCRAELQEPENKALLHQCITSLTEIYLSEEFLSASLPLLPAEDWTTMEDNSVVVPFRRETV